MQTFWEWLFRGSNKSPAGIRNILNKYIVLHTVIATCATSLINGDPFVFATKAIFPAASILIGMSMAWTTRASTILQSKDLRDAIFSEERPAEDYIYSFQLSILTVMLMVSMVAIMAGGGLNIDLLGFRADRIASGFWMYFLMSLSLRECWGVVNFTNMLSMLEFQRTNS